MTVRDQDWHLRTRADRAAGCDAFDGPRSVAPRAPHENQGRNWWIGAAVASALIATGVLLLFRFVFRG